MSNLISCHYSVTIDRNINGLLEVVWSQLARIYAERKKQPIRIPRDPSLCISTTRSRCIKLRCKLMVELSSFLFFEFYHYLSYSCVFNLYVHNSLSIRERVAYGSMFNRTCKRQMAQPIKYIHNMQLYENGSCTNLVWNIYLLFFLVSY